MGVSRWQLISGDDIAIPNIGTIVQPRLRDLKIGTGIGFQTYQTYTGMLAWDIREQAIDDVGARDVCQKMGVVLGRDFTTFDFYIGNEDSRAQLQKALSFFIKEKIEFYPKYMVFLVLDGETPVGEISWKNFRQLADTICEVAHMQIEREELPKNKSESYMKRWFKRRNGRKVARKKLDKDLSLENIVSAVTSRHNSYNYLNVWDLTVYQIYDTFEHMHINEVTDRTRLRWAAWGKDDWENDKLWYQPINNS